jgi:hypothetical protein
MPGATELATACDTGVVARSPSARRLGVRLSVGRVGGVVDVLEREMFLVLVVCASLVLLVVRMAATLANDSWLTLLAGREIAEHGLPATDALTVWSRGADWVDQQWLSQLSFHAVFGVGGVRLALIVNVALVVGGLAVALAAARAAGATARSAAAVGAACLFVALPSTALRAQTLAYPLFAALLWLLARDARRPSPRVFLFVPMLVVWANLHGSAVVGAGLVALAGISFALADVARSRGLTGPVALRAALMALAPWPCLLASPYGLSLVDYYQRTLGNRQFTTVVTEWQASSYPDQLPFFVLLFVVLWLVARYGDQVTLFERLAVVATAAGGLVAVRNVIWFVLAVAAVAPQALERLWPPRMDVRRNRRLNLSLVGAALAATALFVAVAAVRPASSYERGYPAAVADVVARLAEREPGARIYANEAYADWLIWREPQLRGRLAYDARFELLTGAQLTALYQFRNRIGPDWKRAADGFGIVVLDVRSERLVERDLLTERGTSRAYRDEQVSVLLRQGEGSS